MSTSHSRHHEEVYSWARIYRAFILAQSPEITALFLEVIHCGSQGIWPRFTRKVYEWSVTNADAGSHHPDTRCPDRQHRQIRQVPAVSPAPSLAPIQGSLEGISQGRYRLTRCPSGELTLHNTLPHVLIGTSFGISSTVSGPLCSTVTEPTVLGWSEVSCPAPKRIWRDPIRGDDWFQCVPGITLRAQQGLFNQWTAPEC